MSPAVDRPLPIKKPSAIFSRRFSLRTLFFVSFLLGVPFLLAAFVGTEFETADAGGAPIFLLLGAACVATATAVGYSLGNRRGGYVGAIMAGGLWFASAALVLGDVNTLTTFRLHAGAAFVTTSAICWWLFRHQEPEEARTSAATLDRLRIAKQESLAGKWRDHKDAPPAP